jgi:two-component system, NtrC family, sensor kinase
MAAGGERSADLRLYARIAVSGTLILGLMLWQSFGHPMVMVWLVALYFAHLLVVRLLHPWWERSPPGGPADTVLLTAHNALDIAAAHVAGWTPASWLLLPLSIFSGSTHQGRESWRHVVLVLVTTGLAAHLDGVSDAVIGVNLGLCVALYLLWEGRTRILQAALSELEAERLKLESAQEKLVEQEKLSSLGLLAAGVAHEINNPMSYVGSNLRLLVEDLPRLAPESELLREYRDDILPATLDGIERVNTIVADLGRFARGDTGRAKDFDLNQEVTAALRIASNELKDRARTEVSLANLPPVRGRPQELARVVVNLLVNAAHAVGEHGLVRVITRPQAGGVALTVADDGVGMTPETRARVFEPFFTTKPVGQGTGLGLAVVHGIVSRHGGRITVESERGRGSAFTVWLPAAPPVSGDGMRLEALAGHAPIV